MKRNYQPIILVGAARSGTKLVRDLIAHHPAVTKVPYDINFIWRLGNERVPHDELSVANLTPEIQARILRGIDRSRATDAPYLVEKTVGNCLRVPFVHAVFPDAYFILLVRDGRDVIESVYRQWIAPPDWKYLIRKARSYPFTDAFGYALSYARNVILRAIRLNQAKATWGQLYMGIHEDLQKLDLMEVCAKQWVVSIEKSLEGLRQAHPERVLIIKYEEFVCDPCRYLDNIGDFLNIPAAPYQDALEVRRVSRHNIGKGARSLRPEQLAQIMPLISVTLDSLGYL